MNGSTAATASHRVAAAACSINFLAFGSRTRGILWSRERGQRHCHAADTKRQRLLNGEANVHSSAAAVNKAYTFVKLVRAQNRRTELNEMIELNLNSG